jgi:membrane-associated phospholipid phosphatase
MNENKYVIFDYVGSYLSIILFFITIKLLWNKPNLLMYYSYGYFLNLLLNLVLKGIFKQPRPLEDPQLFKLALKNSSRFSFKNGFPHDIFGMPSGHSQSVFYSCIFIYLSLKDVRILIGYILLSLITVYHRVFFQHHTIAQVFVGSVTGVLFAIFIYYMATQKIMGKVNAKKDDNAPI